MKKVKKSSSKTMKFGKKRNNSTFVGWEKKIFAAIDGQAAKGIRLVDWRGKVGRRRSLSSAGKISGFGAFWRIN